MLTALKDEPLAYQVGTWLTLATGLRQEELMGLRWCDIDLEKGTLYIAQVRQYVSRQTIVKDPKTVQSKRLISIPETVIELMKKYKTQQAANKLQLGNKYIESGYMLVRDDGKEYFANTMSNWFPDFLSRHKLPHMNYHGLRHTSATLLIEGGFNAVDVSRRLGHARTSTTLDIYSHAFMKADEKAADTMNDILKKAATKKA